MIVLEYDEPTPSLNLLYGDHWSRRHKHRKKWGWLTRAALLKAKVHERPRWARARVTVERYGKNICDADNVRAGAKALMDSLVAEQIILDDSPAVIGEPVFIQHAGKARKTIVRIEGL